MLHFFINQKTLFLLLQAKTISKIQPMLSIHLLQMLGITIPAFISTKISFFVKVFDDVDNLTITATKMRLRWCIQKVEVVIFLWEMSLTLTQCCFREEVFKRDQIHFQEIIHILFKPFPSNVIQRETLLRSFLTVNFEGFKNIMIISIVAEDVELKVILFLMYSQSTTGVFCW